MPQTRHSEAIKRQPTAVLKNAEAAVIEQAVKTIGNESEAMRWMGTPVRALGYATPISLLYNRKGCRAVTAVLEKLEYGVL